jgi:hypothetical protein
MWKMQRRDDYDPEKRAGKRLWYTMGRSRREIK